MNKTELKRITKDVCEISKQTGQKLVRYQKKIDKLKITSKEAQGVFSEADVEAEKFIFKKLKKLTPGIEILGEEQAFTDFKGKSSAYKYFSELDYCWVVDPLDGTNNFLNGMDYFGVCISLVKKGVPILGVVYRPHLDHLFFSYTGGGSYLQVGEGRAKKIYNEKLSKKLKQSMLVTGFITEKGKPDPKEFKLFLDMMGTSRGIRRMGSAALDLCYVAQGTFDGFWEKGLAPWDTAAAAIICTEAGVKVSDYNGSAFSPFDKSIVAARKPIYKELLSKVKTK